MFKVVLFGIGLKSYWEQFEGPEQRLTAYVDLVGEKLKNMEPKLQILDWWILPKWHLS